MIYLFISNHAEANPDLAIMAINTFMKDLKHKSERVRGLALRNLCNLKIDGAFDYM